MLTPSEFAQIKKPIVTTVHGIAKSYQSRGFSNVMIETLINHISPLMNNNQFVRTSPSKMGKERLFDKFSNSLQLHNIKWSNV